MLKPLGLAAPEAPDVPELQPDATTPANASIAPNTVVGAHRRSAQTRMARVSSGLLFSAPAHRAFLGKANLILTPEVRQDRTDEARHDHEPPEMARPCRSQRRDPAQGTF